MNNLQKIACEISGYEPNEPFTSAKVDDYYMTEGVHEKIDFILDYSKFAPEVEEISLGEAIDIYIFLEVPRDENSRYHFFNSLGIKKFYM